MGVRPGSGLSGEMLSEPGPSLEPGAASSWSTQLLGHPAVETSLGAADVPPPWHLGLLLPMFLLCSWSWWLWGKNLWDAQDSRVILCRLEIKW